MASADVVIAAPKEHHSTFLFGVALVTIEASVRPEGRNGEVAPDNSTCPTPAPSATAGVSRANLKRLMDVFGALVGLVTFAPLLFLVAVLIRLESKGPALFRQRRTGFGGVPFVIYKFRTMKVWEDGPNIIQATRNDARVTPLGSMLRRMSVDELPQLINVLRGEMSLVGPRPHALAHDELYSALVPNYQDRFLAKPGLTGLAQVSGFRGETQTLQAMQNRIEQDLKYIENWSLGLDLLILVRTFISAPLHPQAY